MKTITRSDIVSTGLAIFSMLFGAGNLMYPIAAGMNSGSQLLAGTIGFGLTAVILPLIGLIGMILFNGDINAYFNRIGKVPGQIILFLCVMVIGPVIAMPRIVTLSHTMISPFIPIALFQESAFAFALLFLGITFLATFRENRIVQVLGYVISPLLLISLAIIIAKGLISAEMVIENNQPATDVFLQNILAGYETLDLMATIFFSSIILTILRNTMGHAMESNPRLLAKVSTQAGLIGVSLLGIIYIGLAILVAYHGHGLDGVNPDILFREISFTVTGTYGAALIGTAVLMACLSTAIALGAVVAEYTQKTLFKNSISYSQALVLVLASCIPLSVAGLGYVRQIAGGPLLYVGYPVLIALTICNIAYQLVGFRPVKLPVLITFCVALAAYLWL